MKYRYFMYLSKLFNVDLISKTIFEQYIALIIKFHEPLLFVWTQMIRPKSRYFRLNSYPCVIDCSGSFYFQPLPTHLPFENVNLMHRLKSNIWYPAKLSYHLIFSNMKLILIRASYMHIWSMVGSSLDDGHWLSHQSPSLQSGCCNTKEAGP